MSTACRQGPGLSVHLTLLTVQLLFGGFHVVGKAVLAEVPPLALAGFRVMAATPVLLWVAWSKDQVIPKGRDLAWLALLGFLGVFANQLLFIVGLSYTTATHASILMPSIPAFTVALGALLGIERAGPWRILGVASAAAGALVMLQPTSFSLSSDTVVGDLLILCNALSYSAFLVLQRPVLERLPWRTVIAGSFFFGGLGVLAVSAPSLARLEMGAVSPEAWSGVVYVAFVATTLGYLLATWAVRRSSPLLVAAYTTLQPLASASLAALFLGETVGLREAAGFLLIVAGLFAVSRQRPGPPP